MLLQLLGWSRHRARWMYLFIGVTLIILYSRHSDMLDRLGWFGTAGLLASFLLYLILRKKPRVLPFAAPALTLVVTAYCLVMHGMGLTQSDLPAWVLLGLLASMPRSHLKLSIGLIAYTGGVLLYIDYSAPFPFVVLIAVFGLYLAVQSGQVRREAYELNKLRLEELDRAYSELTHAHEELQEAQLDSMRYAALAERASIARDIHDGLGHHLTSLIIQLQAIDLMLQKGHSEEADQRVREALDLSREGMKEVRRAVREWSEDESMLGLAALRGLVSRVEARSKLRCEWVQDGPISDWPIGTSIALYRVLQESLTNVLKHARAKNVTVRLSETESSVELSITDDGEYRSSDPPEPGFGLTGMRKRCLEAGGSCEFLPRAGGGLTVVAILPLLEPEPDMRAQELQPQAKGVPDHP
ncbi:sensor histidine kinase [Cohnella fermenti]|uniref:histidine kinase n=1 Tax=Cohnella fermenti TaxID=2565925 RepID=A0A4S4BGG9_9BACL|nr:sensor histidine kinase [Cohnella fermenti]THF73547.1 sensor histidine kinase [Cohnella fermenti]